MTIKGLKPLWRTGRRRGIFRCRVLGAWCREHVLQGSPPWRVPIAIGKGWVKSFSRFKVQGSKFKVTGSDENQR
jgi:hypothetical protein